MTTAKALIESVANGTTSARKLVEGDKKYTLKPSALNAKFTKELADSDFDFYLLPSGNDVPVPYDAGFEVQGSKFVIEGGVGPSGAGNCSIEIGLSQADSYYKVVITGNSDDVESLMQSNSVKWK